MEHLIQKNLALKFTPYLALLLLELFIDVSDCLSQAEVNKHLDIGTQYLVKGQLSDALSHYHQAVEGDPNNYVAYFKRATVYLAMGKAKNALSDLDRALEIKPDFNSAKVYRGSIRLKQAEYDLAQLDFYNVLKVDPHNTEANELMQRINPAKESKKTAEYYYGHNDYDNALAYLNQAIEYSPWSAELYDFRAEIHMENGDFLSAVTDIKASTKHISDNTDGYFKLSQLLYRIGHATESLKSIRECLKLDPEHKDCFPFYKKVKKIEKFIVDAENAIEEKNYQEGIESAKKILKNEKEVDNIIFEGKRLLCTLYSKDRQHSEAITACSEALKMREEEGIYCDRAEAYLDSELYDDAIRDYNSALKIDQNSERAKEGLRQAEIRQKQAERRDYYKILEVDRSASKRDIIKAYRKQAQKWHPDNYQNDEKMKKIAEKKFIDIAAAKEVLTDDEKRRQFDAGEDPLDPESGRHGGMHHNFHHFQSFHGSPFQFKFHFN